MTFFKPRYNDFPLLQYAFECVKLGNAYTIVFNAANEVGVQAFLDKKITYTAIPRIVRYVLDKDWKQEITTFEQVFEIDAKAREIAREQI